jgi:hypothetical protein
MTPMFLGILGLSVHRVLNAIHLRICDLESSSTSHTSRPPESTGGENA